MAPATMSDQVFLVLKNGSVSSIHASEDSAQAAIGGGTKMVMETHTLVGGTVNVAKKKTTKFKATKTDEVPVEKKLKDIKPKPAKAAATDDTTAPIKKTKTAAEQLADNVDKPKKGEIDVKSLPDNIQKLLNGSGFVFEDKRICITGIPPVMGRKVANTLVELYGGVLAKSISKTISFVFLDNDAGPKKLEQIKELNVEVVDEDDFVRMIENAGASSKKRAASSDDAKPKAAKKSKK